MWRSASVYTHCLTARIEPRACRRLATVTEYAHGFTELYAKYKEKDAKKIVWSTVVLEAPDQLRQRVAWALAQVFVINQVDGGK